MSKIDIIHIIDNIRVGGAQSMMFELYHAINRYYSYGYNQFIISAEKKPSDELFVSSSDISYFPIKDSSHISKKVSSYQKPVVIYHKLASSLIDIPQQIKRRGVPVIVINHTLYNSKQWSRADGKCCDVMVAVSNHMLESIQKWYPRIRQYACIHNAVNQFRYATISAESREKNKLITGRSNRICSWKHSEKWIRWIKDVDLPLTMIHDYLGGRVGISSSNRPSPKLMKGKKNIVRMLGNISNFQNRVSIMKGWDLFLYETNREEGISMAILESLACGVPVVCSDHFGNKEIIEKGINGYIFSDKNEARSILTYLCNNPQELKNLKEKTIKHFETKLDAKFASEKYIQLINGIVSGDINNSISKISIHVPIEKEKLMTPKNEKKIDNKFSILSSCYNKSKYLHDWSKSILAQSYRPLEVVIANDASTDNSENLLKSFAPMFQEKGIEFKLVTNLSRLYCGSSYRNLVQYATGSYFGILDSDDMLVDDAVEYIMTIYNSHPEISWIYTQFGIYDINMQYKRKGFCLCPPSGQSLLDLGNKRIHGYGHWRTFSSRIKKPSKLFGKSLKCSVDKHMGYRLEEIAPGMFVDRICYKYRQHPVGSPESVSSTKYAIEMWEKVRNDAMKRRKKNPGQKYYPICEGP